MPSSATEISQSHLSLQTSCSRVPVFTLNSAIFCRWAGSSANRIDCSCQDIGYATAWAGLKPKQRAAIGLKCHEALKAMAATVDGDFTEITGNHDDLAQAEEAAW